MVIDDKPALLFIDLNKVLSRMSTERTYEIIYKTRSKIYAYNNAKLTPQINLKPKYTE